jgi:hypothetical protein
MLPASQERRAIVPTHFRRMVDRVLLHWVEFGPSVGKSFEKPTVVLLHGLNDSHLTWTRIAPELARDRRVLVLDLPGHEHSDRPDAGYELAWYGRIVACWIEALGLEPREQVDIVGHSLGCRNRQVQGRSHSHPSRAPRNSGGPTGHVRERVLLGHEIAWRARGHGVSVKRAADVSMGPPPGARVGPRCP